MKRRATTARRLFGDIQRVAAEVAAHGRSVGRRSARRYEVWYLRSGRYVVADVHGRQLRVPRGHPYAPGGYAGQQPLRNRPLELIARALAAGSPNASILDIGANVGDTAVLLGSGGNDLILVEPDPAFAHLLELNLDAIEGVRRIETVVVSGREVRGGMSARAGTSTLVEHEGARRLTSKTLEEVCDDDTRLIKIDTDGWDVEILRSGLGFLATCRPILYFELECRTRSAYDDARGLLDELTGIGYTRFGVWDDSGLLMLGECNAVQVQQLAEALCHGCRGSGQRTTVHGYDVCAVTSGDVALLQEVVGRYRQLQWEL